jgi:hypothetical protein
VASSARRERARAFGKKMNITSRYSDIPEVKIDPAKIPEEFRQLLPLAKEWSITDDAELEAFIADAPETKKREVAAAFGSHFDALWKWHLSCAHLVPQPDELVLFDIAANAANTVSRSLS